MYFVYFEVIYMDFGSIFIMKIIIIINFIFFIIISNFDVSEFFSIFLRLFSGATYQKLIYHFKSKTFVDLCNRRIATINNITHNIY